jgi:hypothetical protein
MWQRYATINWAAAYAAPLFALEALLLLVVGGILNRLPLDQRGIRRAAGCLLIALALAYPLLAPVFGRPWQAAEILGLAPAPTAMGTLGFLLLARGRSPILLWPIPALCCLADVAVLLAMGEAQHWVLLAGATIAAAGLVTRPHTPPQR